MTRSRRKAVYGSIVLTTSARGNCEISHHLILNYRLMPSLSAAEPASTSGRWRAFLEPACHQTHHVAWQRGNNMHASRNLQYFSARIGQPAGIYSCLYGLHLSRISRQHFRKSVLDPVAKRAAVSAVNGRCWQSKRRFAAIMPNWNIEVTIGVLRRRHARRICRRCSN